MTPSLRAVLHRVSPTTDDLIVFAYRELFFELTRKEWKRLGKPRSLTITVEPGAHLAAS